jgi:hypothetical protein
VAADPGTQTEGAQEGAQEAQQGQQEGQEQQPNAVEQRLDDLAGRFDSFQPVLNDLAEALQQGQGQEDYGQQEPGYQQGQPRPQFDPFTGQPLQPQAQEPQFYDPQTGLVDPQALNQHIEQMVQSGIQQGIQPANQQLTEIREQMQDQALDSLAEQYTEMGDPEFLKDFAPRLQAAAAGFGNPEKAFDRDFAEMVYLAGKAGSASDESAEGVPGGNGQAHVEGASSAQQQQSGPPDGDEFWQRIVNAR